MHISTPWCLWHSWSACGVKAWNRHDNTAAQVAEPRRQLIARALAHNTVTAQSHRAPLHSAVGLVYRQNNLIREIGSTRDLTFLHFLEIFSFAFEQRSSLNENKALNSAGKINAAFWANRFGSGRRPVKLSACFINISSVLIWASKFCRPVNKCMWASSLYRSRITNWESQVKWALMLFFLTSP